MKRVILGGVGLGATALVCGGWWLLLGSAPTSDVSTETQLTVTLPVRLAAAQVIPLVPAVSLASSSVSIPALLATTTPVTLGSVVTTATSGRALIAHEDTIITAVNSNTSLVLAHSDHDRHTKLELVAGETWTKILRALEQDEAYELYTPTLVASVRGTSFGVRTFPLPQIIVTEGVVRVVSRDLVTGVPDVETAVVVEAGFILTETEGGFTVRPITPTDKDEWYKEHNEEPPVAKQAAAPAPSEPVLPPANLVPDSFPSSPIAPEVNESPSVPEPTPRITDFDPREIDVAADRLLRIRGTDLAQIDTITINNHQVDFLLTSVGVITIDASDLPDRPSEYDVTIVHANGEDTYQNAFTITEPVLIESEGALTITEAVISPNGSGIVSVRGSGFLDTTAVRVGEQTAQFEILDDENLEVYASVAQAGMTVEVRTSSESTQATIK